MEEPTIPPPIITASVRTAIFESSLGPVAPGSFELPAEGIECELNESFHGFSVGIVRYLVEAEDKWASLVIVSSASG
jgi:hypothetical protein